ncbi:LysR family transcriptional regulator [Chondromyces crocatus]|nr:LysR family transcriptional regulator [Chondromyces crocatus]
MQDLADARWDDVRLFLAAYRERSLGAAAARLGVDTSTISRRLTAFEDAVGKRLFERTREGLTPTRAAEVLVAAAEIMEGGHARLLRDASGVEEAAEGIVRLSAAPGLVDTFITPALPRFHERHPGITLEIDASTRVLDLTRHEADLALRSTPPQGAELIITKIGTARWIAAASAARVDALGRLASWDDAPWLAWDRDMLSFAPSRWLAQHAPKARVVLRTSHFLTQLGAAEAGLGIGLFPEPYLRPRHLVPVRFAKKLAPSTASWPQDGLWVVGHRALRDVPRVAAVWTFMTEELRTTLIGR